MSDDGLEQLLGLETEFLVDPTARHGHGNGDNDIALALWRAGTRRHALESLHVVTDRS